MRSTRGERAEGAVRGRAWDACEQERGSATAELAVVLPVVVLVLGLVLGTGAASARITTTTEAAAAAARSLGRGESQAQARSLAAQVQPDATLQISDQGDLVCVRANSAQRLLGALPLDITQRVCVPRGGR
ncbi:MAG: TadE family type IV pilus minor pilin [Pseudoclavibacter sp.]|uniref:TadE family type IV pilus minor pilin n=1 Tax=Pseudoclavibacter sp. CFCC 13796 TaxID=2615179 RepID=UPI001CE49014|nr:TadE family type IV pilus minor pilin [Pseudoclavibacter sp. CFCC 13796]